MIYDEEHGNAFPAQEQLKASNDVPMKTGKVRRGRERAWTAACSASVMGYL